MLSKERQNTFKKFTIFCFGVFANFSGFLAILPLQSSINIEDGVGAKSVATTYVTAAIFGIVVTPVILRKLGPKICILICELTYFVYILSNYYPVSYVLIPASFFVGIGEATMWPTMILFSVYYARTFAGANDPAMYVTRFLGYFYISIQSSQVFGNLISYGILYGGKTPINSTLNLTMTPDFSACGSHDCQDPNVVNRQITKYHPTSQITLYVSIAVLAGLVLSAFLIHLCSIPSINPMSEGPNNDLIELRVLSDTKRDKNSAGQNDNSLTGVSAQQDQNSLIECPTSQPGNNTEQKPVNLSIIAIIKATLKHIISPKTLLVTPLPIYCGILIAFSFGELTRAFGSCLLGVDQVGILSATFAIFTSLTSYFSCKFASRQGRNIPFLVAFCLDITIYMTCLFWKPTLQSLWVVYVLFAISGCTVGIWQPLVNDLHTSYFPKKEDIALSVWNFYVVTGIAIQSGCSIYLCVNVKVYIQIGLLIFCLLCYGLAEYIYYGKKLAT